MINIVLYQPEISPNTSNIIRTCYATSVKLHIIKPIAFELHPHWMKRQGAGIFLSDVDHEVHSSYEQFYKKYGHKKIFYITRYGKKTYSDINFKEEFFAADEEIFLMFGRESTGIDLKILQENLSNCLRIPMDKKNRSLNLANSVAILVYEVLRQLNFLDLSVYEVQKGQDFLEKIILDDK